MQTKTDKSNLSTRIDGIDYRRFRRHRIIERGAEQFEIAPSTIRRILNRHAFDPLIPRKYPELWMWLSKEVQRAKKSDDKRNQLKLR